MMNSKTSIKFQNSIPEKSDCINSSDTTRKNRISLQKNGLTFFRFYPTYIIAIILLPTNFIKTLDHGIFKLIIGSVNPLGVWLQI